MELLQQPVDRGYPVEYLLSRIKGRRSRLITDWKTLVYEYEPLEYLAFAQYVGPITEKTPDAVWLRLAKEYQWIYAQMNAGLREVFYPFFLYSELRTLYICLRHLQNKTIESVNDVLEASLLSDEIKDVCATSDDAATAINRIEHVFLSRSGTFNGLVSRYEQEGLRGVEQQITNSFLQHTMQQAKLHPLLREYFSLLIDSRNILALYKQLRSMGKDVTFIPGGHLIAEDLEHAGANGNLLDIGPLVKKYTGSEADVSRITDVEKALYQTMTKFLRKAGRRASPVGLILDYIWRCSIEAMNLSVLFQGKGLERDEVMAELVVS